jgi:hypothetical protein
MRDPRINPRKGDKLAKVTDNRVHTRTVIGVTNGIVCYTPKRVRCYCSLKDWRKWAKDAQVPADYQKAKEPYRKRPVKDVVVQFTLAELDKLSNAEKEAMLGLRPGATRQIVARLMKNYAGTMQKLAKSDPNVLYAHEFAHQLLAGENKRIVVVLPTFDMPGMATAHTPQAVPSKVEDVECLVITAKP